MQSITTSGTTFPSNSGSVSIKNPEFSNQITYADSYVSTNINYSIADTELGEDKIAFVQTLGFDEKDLDISVIENRVVVKGERDFIKGYDGYTNQSDKFTINTSVYFNEDYYDGEKVECELKNGLLRVFIPFRQEKVKKIKIKK